MRGVAEKYQLKMGLAHMGLYLAVAAFMLDSRYIPGPINLSLSNAFLIFTLVAVLLRMFSGHNNGQGFLSPVDKTSLVLGAGLILGAIISLSVAQYPGITLRLLITNIGGLIVLFLPQVLMGRVADAERLLKVYTLGATTCAMLGVIQALLARFAGVRYGRVLWSLGGGFGSPPVSLNIPRVTSTWLDPNIYGVFLVPAVILSLGLPFRHWVKGLLAATLVAGLAVSYSRTAWISTAVGITVFFALFVLTRKSGQGIRIRDSTIVLKVILLLLLGLALIFLIPWQDIWAELVAINRSAFEERIEMTKIGLEYWSIVGVGPGNFLPISGAFTHNSYISVMIEYGIIGGLAWLLLIARTAWIGITNVFRYARSELRPLSIASLSAFASLLVGGLSIEIQNDKFVWLMIAVVTILGTRLSPVVRSRLADSEDAFE